MAKRKGKPQKPVRRTAELVPAGEAALLRDVRNLITSARDVTAAAVNSAIVLLYWQVGTRIRTGVLGSKRVGYGEQIVPTLSAQLVAEFGDEFGARNLFRQRQSSPRSSRRRPSWRGKG
ncbi:MAG: hypothetical protein C0501_04910 [Isosphaera sp.]|nr:hypothetical protein [Isosphaera sp.]